MRTNRSLKQTGVSLLRAGLFLFSTACNPFHKAVLQEPYKPIKRMLTGKNTQNIAPLLTSAKNYTRELAKKGLNKIIPQFQESLRTSDKLIKKIIGDMRTIMSALEIPDTATDAEMHVIINKQLAETEQKIKKLEALKKIKEEKEAKIQARKAQEAQTAQETAKEDIDTQLRLLMAAQIMLQQARENRLAQEQQAATEGQLPKKVVSGKVTVKKPRTTQPKTIPLNRTFQ